MESAGRSRQSWQSDDSAGGSGEKNPLIAFYVDLGRRAAEAGELEQAIRAYRKALQCCHLANLTSAGGYQPQQRRVNREYASVLLGRTKGAA